MKNQFQILFYLLLTGWTLFLVNGIVPFYQPDALHGAFTPSQDTVLSWKTWWSGRFQKKMNLYCNDHVGFHPNLVRLNNQIDYSLFSKLHAKSVLIGKNGFLYENGFNRTLEGKDFIGSEAMAKRMRKLKSIQDTLQKQGIPLLVILAPNKTRTYPEFLPDYLPLHPVDSNNYNISLQLLKELNIPFMDVSEWFVKIKSESPYPLFSPYGIHWSRYGVALVADSLTHYLNQNGCYTPELTYTMKYEKDKTKIRASSDFDIGLGLNLMFSIPLDSMPYPEFNYIHQTDCAKSAPLFLADSYYWMFIYEEISRNQFGNQWVFWNYGKEIWTQEVMDKHKPCELINNKLSASELYKYDAFILIISEGNLSKFGYGMLD